MSELISADAALKELLCGKKVERCYKSEWEDLTSDDPIDIFFTSESFRLKPRTITLNGIEVPAPFEPKEEDQYWYLDSSDPQGYNTDIRNHEEMFSQFKKTAFCQIGLWRTEKEIKQVVAALRSIFGKK